MSKIHPGELDGIRGYSPKDIEDTINDLVGNVHRDDNDRSAWITKQQTGLERRYARLDRGTDWPWPGAADMVMPVEDMKIEEMKSVLNRVTFGSTYADFILNRPAPDLARQQVHDKIFFNWMVMERIRDFRQQLTIAYDTLLQYGISPVKTYWDYRCQQVKRVFRRRDFLSRYPDLLNQLTEIGSQAAFMDNPMDLLEGGNPAITKQISSRVIDSMQPLIIRDCGLDPEEKMDALALDLIMKGLKEGKDYIPYGTLEVINDLPRTVAIDPQDFIVPSSATIGHASRKTHRLWLTEEQIVQRAKSHKRSSSAVDRVLDSGRTQRGKESSTVLSTSRFNDMLKDRREGISGFMNESMYEIWETHWWMDTDNDGIPEPVWAMIHPGTSTLLKDIRHEPYESGNDPFDVFTFELNDQRFYSSRGIPEKLADVAWEVTLRHRAKLNNMDMLVPAFTKKVGSFLEAGDVNFIPGEFYEVVDHDALKPIPLPDYTFQEDREEVSLLGWVERYIGGLNISASQQSIHEARTKAEIDAIQQGTRDIMAYRIMLVQMTLKKIYNKIWDLHNQWGSSTVYQKVTGQRFIRKSKDEILNDYTIVPVGRMDTGDPSMEGQADLQRLQVLMGIAQNNGPVLDNKFRINIGEAARRWLETVAPLDVSAVLEEIPEEERQQMAQEQKQAADLGRSLDENIPISLEEARELGKQVSRGSPHGKLQRMRQG